MLEGSAMVIEADKRQRTRIHVDARVVLHTESKAFFLDGVTRDISMRGLYAKIDFGFPVGTECQVEIILAGQTSELTIKVEGTIVRREDGGCGVLFKSDLEWWPVFAMHIASSESSADVFLEEDLADLED
jgi:hypothetical protein